VLLKKKLCELKVVVEPVEPLRIPFLPRTVFAMMLLNWVGVFGERRMS
jgi:hypothetical protein